MNLTHDGLTLWFGTPDAPGPFDDEVVPRSGVSLIIGVHPPSPTNVVLVHYRIDKGGMRAVPGRELRIDYSRDAQYFSVDFPPFVTGEVVEYWPVLSCAGRQVPAAQLVRRARGFFRLEPKRDVRERASKGNSENRGA